MERDVSSLASSAAWLRVHGLKASGLSLAQLLPRIGFKHREDYVPSIKKSVSSLYAGGLFPHFVLGGALYNLTASLRQLQDLCERLNERSQLLQERLDWLTTGSRQLFGVIQEDAVTLVLDFGATIGAHFRLSREVVCLVIREQVSQINRFNIICSTSEDKAWMEETVCTTTSNIEAAVDWVWRLQSTNSSMSHTARALAKASKDSAVEAVYLFTVGDIKDPVDIPKKDVKAKCPIHVVSFNSKTEGTLHVLKELSIQSSGRFHAFAELHPFDQDCSDEIGESDYRNLSPHQTNLRLIGRVPPGAGVREDVFLVWQEMEEAHRIKVQIRSIMLDLASPLLHKADSELQATSDTFLSSKAWLACYGLKAQKLLLHDILADCTFRHADGVMKTVAMEGCRQTDSGPRNKLINAKYCNRFVHMKWKDGSLVHVYISADKCRQYERQMETATAELQKRMNWAVSGSRKVFGIVVEEQVYVLIDTSDSVREHLPFLKGKLCQLLDEQLCHKAKVNFIEFGSRINPWMPGLTKATERNLESAQDWVKSLKAGGSTNMLPALDLALSDPETHAVYLLSSGSIDQSSKQFQSGVPVHTISYRCSDKGTNHFLYQLACETGGRYHCYPCSHQDAGSSGPHTSDDIRLLIEEIDQGKKDLESVLQLRAECVALDLYHNGMKGMSNSWSHSAPCRQKCAEHAERKRMLQSSSKPGVKPAYTGHTKASLLRYLSGGANSVNEAQQDNWMLPESRSLLQANAAKKNQVLNCLELMALDASEKCRPKRKPEQSLDVTSERWLQSYGLVARRLTITDAVAFTAIQQKGKYVPILEKTIHSKVFGELQPLTHIINGTQQLVLINPLAVKLEDYKMQVQDALCGYERRLALIIWRVLPAEERERFDCEGPVSFQKHREALLQALERTGWPLPREDIDLLEDQIRLGNTYLQQASDLQQAALEMSAERQNKTVKSKSAVKPQEKKPTRVLDSLRCQRVVACSEGDGFYYSGIVRRCLKGERVIVDFSSGKSETIPLRFLIPIGGAIPCPPLALGDFVLVSSGKKAAGECFVPGVVIATPCKLEPTDKLYTVVKYNNRKVHTVRNKISKISPSRYALTCESIRKCQQHNTESDESDHFRMQEEDQRIQS